MAVLKRGPRSAPQLPGRPTPPVFRKVHDFADILNINVKDRSKMIKLPMRYKYLPEHSGAIRATVLAGLEQLPQHQVLAPPPPAVHGLPPGPQGPQGPPGPQGPQGPEGRRAKRVDEDEDMLPGSGGSAGSGGGTPPGMAGVLQVLEAGLQRGEEVRAAARRQEMEDELQLMKMRQEQHVQQGQAMARMEQILQQQPKPAAVEIRDAQPPVIIHKTDVHQTRHTDVHHTAVHNVQQVFQHIQAVQQNVVNNVQEVHNKTMHHLSVNAPRVLQIAAAAGIPIEDAYRRAIGDVAASSSQPPPPPPPPPAAGAVSRAALAIADIPVAAPSPPKPLALPAPPVPKAPQPKRLHDRELPSGPMEDKKLTAKQRLQETREKAAKVREKETVPRARRTMLAIEDVDADTSGPRGVRRTIRKQQQQRAVQDEPEEEPPVAPKRRRMGVTRKRAIRVVQA